MTEFIRILRFGTKKEKKEALKRAGTIAYYTYGEINQPHKDSRVIKKNQIEIIEFETTVSLLFYLIRIKFRKVYIISPYFFYRLVYTKKGRLLTMDGGAYR